VRNHAFPLAANSLETTATGKHRRRQLALAAALLLLLLLLAGLHLFLTYRARQLLPSLVSAITDGRYRLSAETFHLSYLNPEVRLAGVTLEPAVRGLDEEYHVKVDSLYLSIASILPVFLNEAIQVKKMRVVHPSVIVRRRVRMKGQDKDEIHLRVSEMQNNAVLLLNELSVEACDLVNGSFRFYPIPNSERQFNIEHVDLSIRDLVVPPYEGKKTKGIEGRIRLTVNDPQLRIPDSLVSIHLDRFSWDNQERFLNVGRFVISQRASPPQADSFLVSLETIRVSHVYWDEWLNSGLVKMDTLIAHNGDMFFGSSAGRPRRKPVDSARSIRTLKVWDAIGDLDIGYFSARYINAAIVNTHPGMERSNSVKGDSLIIRNLSVLPAKEDPLHIGDLDLGVREFIDRGANRRFQSSFSRMQLKGDTMILDNYLVQSTPQSRLGMGSSLRIPRLTIEGLSIDDLMAEKASVREVRMGHPELVLVTDLSGEGVKDVQVSRKTLDEIRPYVDVERVILDDATVTIHDRRDRRRSLGTRSFSSVILSRSALQASDMDGLASSFRDVRFAGFFYVTPGMRLELSDGRLDYPNRSLRAGRATGYIGSRRIQADLSHVELVGHPDLHPFLQGEGWHFRKLSVDSGSLEFRLDSGSVADTRDPDRLLGLVDSLSLGRLTVNVKRRDLTAGAYIRRARVEGHRVYPKRYHWEQASVNLSDLRLNTDRFNLTGATADLILRGRSGIRDAHVTLRSGKTDLDIRAPLLTMVTDLSEIDARQIPLDFLRMEEPVIRLSLSKTSAEASDTARGKRSFTLKQLELDRPNMDLRLPGDAHEMVFGAVGHMIRASDLVYLQEGQDRRFTLGDCTSQLDELNMNDDDNDIFRTGKLDLQISHFRKLGAEPAGLDLKRFRVGAVNVNHSWKRDTLELNTGGIELGNIPSLLLRKDSLLVAAFKIPPAIIEPSTFTLRTPQKKFSIRSFRLNTDRQFLEWDSLEVQNRISRDSFFASHPFEKDYITFSTGRIRAYDLKPVLYRNDTAIYIRKLSVDPLQFKVERDKRRPDDTLAYRPLMTRMLRRLPFLLRVDSIELERSVVWHNVIDDKTQKEGTIFFTDVRGVLTNVKNYDIQGGDSLRLDLSTRLMGKGNMRVQFRERYEDSAQGFLLATRMGSLEMTELNRLMLPLFSVRAERGRIRDLYMKVRGSDELAYGSMEMNYDRLRLSVFDEEGNRKGMASWLANLFVRGSNNKVGIIYVERLKEKSIFNFWARISVNGLLTNLGVRQNGKQVRRFYRGLPKDRLPPDLF
jgi:hypothetical protein